MELVVGIGVLVLRKNTVLLGRRKGSLGASSWGLPRGHLESGETIEECASRELLEETGLTIIEFTRAGFTRDVFEVEQKQYVTLFVETFYSGVEPVVMEPDKCDAWQWFAWDELPDPLFAPFDTLLKNGYTPSQV